jgi:GntR family transcriptional repressor for pyruvate dehydrogenase complex
MSDRSPKRVFEDVVQQIRLDIAKGKIKPGDRLPADPNLEKRFGVGRSSIREAIRALELFGLVWVKRGRDGGAYFTPDCQKLARDSFSQLSFGTTTLSDSLEFRKALEPHAAGLAARRATADDVAELRRSIRMMQSDVGSAESFVESNRIFHEAIAHATRNPYFQEMIPQFLMRDEIVSATRSSETMERSMTRFFHTRITDAIAKRDADAAEFWMLGHLSQIEEDVAHAQELAKRKLKDRPRKAARGRTSAKSGAKR